MFFFYFLGFCKKCLDNANTAYEDCIKFYKSVPSGKDVQHCEDVRKDLTLKCPDVCHGKLRVLSSFLHIKYCVYNKAYYQCTNTYIQTSVRTDYKQQQQLQQ